VIGGGFIGLEMGEAFHRRGLHVTIVERNPQILPLLDRDEPRFAEASREMGERGVYTVPYFNNTYRFDKPPLIYWLQSLAYALLVGLPAQVGLYASMAPLVLYAIFGTSRTLAVMSVSVRLGQIVFTRILYGPSSSAMHLDIISIAALDVL